MERIRKIVQQELLKVLMEMNNPTSFAPNEEEILYNFEAGRAFGVNKIARDINGLEEYYMSDYFPRSEVQEGWMFELATHYGGSQLVEIIHKLEGASSLWSLRIAEVERGSNEPQIVADLKNIEGYKNFVDAVNSQMEKLINPNLL